MHRLFPSQQQDEEIYLVVREHWVRLLFRFFIWAIVAAAYLGGRSYGPVVFPDLFSGTAGQVVAVLFPLGAMGLLLALLLIWVMHYLNIQVVTNMRIVDIDQVGLFHHTVAELHIENIEDVTSETSGVFGTIFGYGNVFVQTAGTKERFEFEGVGNPAAIEKLVLDLYDSTPHDKHID